MHNITILKIILPLQPSLKPLLMPPGCGSQQILSAPPDQHGVQTTY